VDDALRALAHPARRRMLERVLDGERTSTELAAEAGLRPPAASQHLKVLRDAGLVRVRVDGNRRLYRARAERLAEVRAVLEAFWGERLAVLRDRLERPEGDGG
jgi:DNA-binding transcriptional ArsR family regulator